MPNLYIIAGCNGAGKTTASFTILPELLKVREFVNADEIARGLSPFQPETVSLQAGRIMLTRLDELVSGGTDFAFETTLATRSFVGLVQEARTAGYRINLAFYWLNEEQMAIDRVKKRVAEGGHNIPSIIIIRRYRNGLKNFLTLYKNLVDSWLLFDNSTIRQELVAEGGIGRMDQIHHPDKWNIIEQFG